MIESQGQRDTSLQGLQWLLSAWHMSLAGSTARVSPVDGQLLQRSHSGIRAKCLSLWVLSLPLLSSRSPLEAPSMERRLGPGTACDAKKEQM